MPTPRKLIDTDASIIAAIEAQVLSSSWSAAQFAQSLHNGDVGWGHSDDERGDLISYCLFNVVIDEAALLNLAVVPARQRQGLAAELLEYSLRCLADRGVVCCHLEVRESNLPAIRLYQRLAFTQVGVRRNYYPRSGGREAALLFSRGLKI